MLTCLTGQRLIALCIREDGDSSELFPRISLTSISIETLFLTELDCVTAKSRDRCPIIKMPPSTGGILPPVSLEAVPFDWALV